MQWKHEAQPLPESDAVFASFTLAPLPAVAITELSRQLIMQASPAAGEIVRQTLERTAK